MLLLMFEPLKIKVDSVPMMAVFVLTPLTTMVFSAGVSGLLVVGAPLLELPPQPLRTASMA
ncbi:MAG: hypothetical protein ACEQSD_12025, partial [Flavobacteriales bacterium]